MQLDLVKEAKEALVQQSVVSILDTPLNLDELMAAMETMQNGKALGRDGIPAEVWKFGGIRLPAQAHSREMGSPLERMQVLCPCSRKVTVKIVETTKEYHCWPMLVRFSHMCS